MNKSKFDRTLSYNSLPFLPPKTDIGNDVKILKKLVSASRALSDFNGSMLRLPNPFMLVNTIALQEAKSSTEIENIFTTNDELYKAISDNKKEKQVDNATKEVLKYREALWAGFNSLSEKKHIDLELIVNIFQQIKETTVSIRSPHTQIVIRRGNRELRPGEVVYTPPRGEKILNDLITNLLEYINDDKKYPTDPLLKMCIAHYQFEVIHPFHDGNGRTGRILNLLYLKNKNLLSHPILYLSKYIILNKDDYYYRLSEVTNRNDWVSWILFMLDAIEQTAIYSSSLIDDILDQMASTLSHGKKLIKWYNKEVNELIFSQPYTRPGLLSNLMDRTSRTTLTKYFSELVSAKILRPKKEGKEVYYINDDLLKILEG